MTHQSKLKFPIRLLTLGAAMAAALAGTARAQAPANDQFANRIVVAGSTNLVAGSNLNATREAGEPSHLGADDGASVWWSWLAPDSGLVTIDTRGSAIDTLLAVYTGDSISSLSLVAENDDFEGESTGGVQFEAVAGTVYQIAVDGFEGIDGAVNLNIRLPVEPTAPTIVSGPSDAIAIEGLNTNIVFKVAASGSRPFSYQWQWNGINLAGQTSDTLTLTNPAAADAGIYRVTVANPAGEASTNATLTVNTTVANDFFAGRTVINGVNTTALGQNRTATAEAGDPAPLGLLGGRSVWWTWTAAASGLVEVDTIGSTFDTVLGVYKGTSLANLSYIAENDEDKGMFTSAVWFRANAGETFQILVDGYKSAETGVVESGDISLRVTQFADNDFFANSRASEGAVVVSQVSNRGATRESGEPVHSELAAGHTVWLSWQAPDSGPVTLDTLGSEFPTYFAVYTGDSLANLQLVGSHEDTNQLARIRFSATAGVTYRIVVDGIKDAAEIEGGIVVSLSQTFAGNDDFASRTPLLQSTNYVTGISVSATKEPGEPAHAGSFGGRSLWWSWVAPFTGPVTIATTNSSFDTVLAVYTGSAVNGLELVASNDDFEQHVQSLARFNAVKGQEYEIAVDGYAEGTSVSSGVVRLSVQQPEPPSLGSNDLFANRIAIEGQTNSVESSTVSAAKEAGEPDHSGNRGGHSVWWKWVAPESEPVTIDTIGSSFDTVLGIYTGSDVAHLTRIDSDDDSAGDGLSSVTFLAVAGVEYQIAVDGYLDGANVANGSVVLNLSQYPHGPQIANDDFVNRTPIFPHIPVVFGSNIGATREAGEPNHFNDPTGASVWWSLVLNEFDHVVIDTQGSSFDTVLAVYTGTSMEDLQLVVENDDIGGGIRQSRVEFEAEAGVEYLIVVEGYSGKIGSVQLNLEEEENLAESPMISSQPSGHTRFLNGGGGGTNAVFKVVAVGTPPLSYQWQKDGVNIDGATSATLTLTNAGPADVGAYRAMVSNSLGTAASVNAPFWIVNAPFNDNFSARIAIAGSSNTLHGSGLQATKEAGEPLHAGNEGDHSVWWTWTAPASGPVSVDTYGSSFDTGLAIYDGTVLDALTLLVENDDLLSGRNNNSFVVFNAVAGHQYQIAVDSFKNNDTYANIVLNLRQPPAGPAIVSGPQSQSVTAGGNLTLSVVTAGVAPLFHYQWFKGLAAVDGGTNSTLVLTNMTTADRGQYRVQITNDFGSATAAGDIWVRQREPVAQKIVSAQVISSGGVRIQFTDADGQVSTDTGAFAVQGTSELAGAATVWAVVPGLVMLQGGQLTFEDAAPGARRIYRIIEK